MITKAIVEAVLTPHQVKIRIPLFDRSNDESLSTKLEYLHTATICTLPQCYLNVQVGDVVFVGFEDNKLYKPVILGHLSREADNPTYMNVTFNNLVANGAVSLPPNTTIGDVSAEELANLHGVRNDIQAQIDMLKTNQEKIMQALNL